ncbi:MAG: hypothetical protein DRP57_07295 [Spirochaetes bacterium]|nr:MAG: hypothetical protein DRP57_07295 [Spirochaetota bacterium]
MKSGKYKKQLEKKSEKNIFEIRKPNILIPYPGPYWEDGSQDIVIYLRPETNGVMVESTLLKVIRKNELYKKNIRIVYLANLPGDFIIKNKIVERHYSVKLYFTVGGKDVFTPFMKRKFEEHFGIGFSSAFIMGAFEALDFFKLNYDELFNIWVPENDVLTINGQSIKKYRNVFIVNYDVPAILHKNSYKTDIAAMIFRSTLNTGYFHSMITEMAKACRITGILDPLKPVERVFHYSKSPYEQILDSIGYIYSLGSEHIEYKDISFFNYLLFKGLNENDVLNIINHPIMHFKDNLSVTEENIFLYTTDMSYSEAYSCLSAVVSQPYLTYRR